MGNIRSMAHLALSLTDFTLTRTLEVVRVLEGLVAPGDEGARRMADAADPAFDPRGWPEPAEDAVDSGAAAALLARRAPGDEAPVATPLAADTGEVTDADITGEPATPQARVAPARRRPPRRSTAPVVEEDTEPASASVETATEKATSPADETA